MQEIHIGPLVYIALAENNVGYPFVPASVAQIILEQLKQLRKIVAELFRAISLCSYIYDMGVCQTLVCYLMNSARAGLC